MSLAAIVFSSCTKEKPEADYGLSGITFDAVFDESFISSKLSVAEGKEGPALSWAKGDEMKLWPSGNATAPILFKATAFDSATGKISFESVRSGDQDAAEKFRSSKEMYVFSANSKANNSTNPFSTMTSDPTFSSNKVMVSNSQTAVAGSFDPVALPFLAYWKGDTPGKPQFSLKLCCSLLKFHIDVSEGTTVKSISLKNNYSSSPGIAGSFNWKFTSGDVVLSQLSGSSSQITLSPSAKDGSILSGDYYVIVAPGRRLYHPSVTFTYGDGKSEQFDNYEIDIAAADMKRAAIFDIGTFALPKDPSKLDRIRIGESESWVRTHMKDYIVEGSVLDFSAEPMFDAPAGKHGWLKTANGHFEFENLPGTEQRFYGTNISNTVNYPSHEEAVAFADRMARSGYNLLRVHHYDKDWNSAENIDRLDFLIAELIKRGIYITTDLYVSRNVAWRDIAIDKDGDANLQLYKFLVGSLYEPALNNWKAFAKSFIEHENPYTGRAYKDEPALCMISLINEGGLSFVWSKAQTELPEFADSVYAEYEKSEGAAHTFPDFVQWFNARVYNTCSAYVRSLGCKALLTNDNNGQSYHSSGGSQKNYDYVDEHYYCASAANPLSKSPFYFVYKPGSSEVKTVSEYNHNAPIKYRVLGSVYGTAYMSALGWDSVCRFAFAEHLSNLVPSDDQGPTTYCICKDELMLASEPAGVMFFGRHDVTSTSQISVSDMSLSINTGKSLAVWKESGTVSAGVLSASISGAPSVIFACALNGDGMSDARRILLTHMTDVQGIGSVLSKDWTEAVIWGHGQVVEVGSADISLSLDSPSSYKVYAVDASGARVSEVNSSVSGGKLCFTVSTASGILRYEIVR